MMGRPFSVLFRCFQFLTCREAQFLFSVSSKGCKNAAFNFVAMFLFFHSLNLRSHGRRYFCSIIFFRMKMLIHGFGDDRPKYLRGFLLLGLRPLSLQWSFISVTSPWGLAWCTVFGSQAREKTSSEIAKLSGSIKMPIIYRESVWNVDKISTIDVIDAPLNVHRYWNFWENNEECFLLRVSFSTFMIKRPSGIPAER